MRGSTGYPLSMRQLVLLVLFVLVPTSAFADLTVFLGANSAPTNRLVRGFSGGISLIIIGFEFEYANTSEDLEELAPSLKTYMFNGLVQTPIAIGGFQPYGTAGAGVYRERLTSTPEDIQETYFGVNVGGGVKINVLGPLRLRLDYRVFTLKGSPLHSHPQRFYAGANLKF
jgi:opacity protein-like surface antigen